jgi:putative hydroxymethylpyrimidine transport system substrate-binding protein
MKSLRCILVLAVLAGFFSPAPDASGGDKLTVMLDWFVNPDHGPLYVGLEKNYFRDAGLEVTFVAPSNPNDPPKLVAAGKADLAVSYQPQHHLHVDKGLPLVRVATLVATPLNSLVVLADGPIRRLADLKGRTIGYSVGGFEDVLLKIMLEREGIRLQDVTLVNVNFSLSPALFGGRADAVIGAFRNFELNQMELENRPGRAFYVEEHGIPAYDELILVAHKERISDPAVRRFVDALEKSTQYMINHPDLSWQLFIKGREELDNELNRRAWKDTLPRFALRPGALDRTRYLRFSRFLKDQGMMATAPPIENLAVELND